MPSSAATKGHAILCQTESDAKVRTIKSTVRFTYNGPTTLAWRQEKGELKSVDGRWKLEDLGGNRTRATYSLEVDLGRMLSLVIRGPLVDLLRGMLVSARAGELKRRILARPPGSSDTAWADKISRSRIRTSVSPYRAWRAPAGPRAPPPGCGPGRVSDGSGGAEAGAGMRRTWTRTASVAASGRRTGRTWPRVTATARPQAPGRWFRAG